MHLLTLYQSGHEPIRGLRRGGLSPPRQLTGVLRLDQMSIFLCHLYRVVDVDAEVTVLSILDRP